MVELLEIVDTFIERVEDVYPDVKMGYILDAEGLVHIRYNNEQYVEDTEFKRFVGKQIREIFYECGIFNVSFNYMPCRL